MSNIDKREIHDQQLKAFITGFLGDPAHDKQSSRSLTAEVFRIALASLEAEPVYQVLVDGSWTDYDKQHLEELLEAKPSTLFRVAYPSPRIMNPVSVDADDNFYSWFGREWHEHYQHNQYTTAAKQMLGVMAESEWKAGRRAAMLQGSEPDFREISNSSTKHFRENAETSTNCPCCGRKPLKHSKCSVPGCGRKHVAHGLCQRHYDMKRREDPEQVEKFREANRRFTARKRANKAAPQQEVK